MTTDTTYFLRQRTEMRGFLEALFHIHDSEANIKLPTLLPTLM